jgi:FlaG/FlaF family flagellin (archaellin)
VAAEKSGGVPVTALVILAAVTVAVAGAFAGAAVLVLRRR